MSEPERVQAHDIDVLYVPICSVCQRGVYLDDDERWQHEETAPAGS